MATAIHPHPWYPRDLVYPDYHPNVLPFQLVLFITFGVIGLIVLAGQLLGGRYKLSSLDRWWVSWFLASGSIHLFMEGNLVADSKFYTDSTGNIWSEIWKEYANADSRYVTRDAFTIQMEGVTAFLEGPTCFLIAYGLCHQRAWRYVAMILVSTGEFYGVVLYYLTAWHDGITKYSRPEFLYFYFYFWFLNGIWFVIPLLNVIHCARKINKAVVAAQITAKKKTK